MGIPEIYYDYLEAETKIVRGKKTLYKKVDPREYLRRYLEVTPLSLAVQRSIEAKHISSVRLEKPILDLGCGFGEFAGVFFEGKVEVGVDISKKELKNAQKTKKYKKLVQADAKKLPFKNNTFKTIIAVSTLEHIENVNEAFLEVFRVLTPGGRLVFTVNLDRIDIYLFWPKILKKIGLRNLADSYPNFYHEVFKHKSLGGKKKWTESLKKAGFKIEELREIFSPEATAHFDRFLITAWPSQLAKLIIGRRWVWRPRWFREWLVARYSWLVEREEKEGSNLFVVAVKPARKS